MSSHGFWSGIDALIFGDNPSLEAELRAALGTEWGMIRSFKAYDEAFDYAKAQKSVGLIFLLDGSPAQNNMPIDGQLTQLLKPFESAGWPGRCVVVGPSRFGSELFMSGKILLHEPGTSVLPDLRERVRLAYGRALQSELMTAGERDLLVALSGEAHAAEVDLFAERCLNMMVLAEDWQDLPLLDWIRLRWYRPAKRAVEGAPALANVLEPWLCRSLSSEASRRALHFLEQVTDAFAADCLAKTLAALTSEASEYRAFTRRAKDRLLEAARQCRERQVFKEAA